MAVCFESPVFIAPLIRLLKTQNETYENKTIILDIIRNLVCGDEKVLIALNSPACDTYMTLLKLLIQDTKTKNARSNPTGLSAQIRTYLMLQDKAIDLFEFIFDQRRPSIIRDLSCVGSAHTLLKEQGMEIPTFIRLPDIMEYYVDKFEDIPEITPEEFLHPKYIMNDYIPLIKDLKCWIKHFYEKSSLPELSKIKALQRCVNLLLRLFKQAWRDYFFGTEDQEPDDEESNF